MEVSLKTFELLTKCIKGQQEHIGILIERVLNQEEQIGLLTKRIKKLESK